MLFNSGFELFTISSKAVEKCCSERNWHRFPENIVIEVSATEEKMSEIARSKVTTRRRYCPGPEKFVELSARVSEEGGVTKVVKWESCDAQNWCGKKCNLFFLEGTADYQAFSDSQTKEL